MLRFVPHTKRLRPIALAVFAALALTAFFALRSESETFSRREKLFAHGRMASIPQTIVWAWERPEKLDFINPREMGVAYLARTIYLRDERVLVRPRLQPLDVPAGTILIAVARIESDRHAPPRLSTAQLTRTAETIAEMSRTASVAAVQIDFDAGISERDFYRALLLDLRRRLPQGMPLTITALASWCTHDDWLSGLPVDEAVPMLFRMGVDRPQINAFLKTGEQFRPRVCRTSAGISTDEALEALPVSNLRLYVFHPRPWTEAAARTTLERYRNEKEIP